MTSYFWRVWRHSPSSEIIQLLSKWLDIRWNHAAIPRITCAQTIQWKVEWTGEFMSGSALARMVALHIEWAKPNDSTTREMTRHKVKPHRDSPNHVRTNHSVKSGLAWRCSVWRCSIWRCSVWRWMDCAHVIREITVWFDLMSSHFTSS